MLWPPLVRFLLFLLPWEFMELALIFCIPSAVTWANIVRSLVTLWLIVRCNGAGQGSTTGSKPKWKRKRRSTKVWKRLGTVISSIGQRTTNILDQGVTWAIGSEPTEKEMMTWRDPTINYQQRVR